jgi:hypothetical protein
MLERIALLCIAISCLYSCAPPSVQVPNGTHNKIQPGMTEAQVGAGEIQPPPVNSTGSRKNKINLRNGLIAYYKFDGSPTDSLKFNQDFNLKNVSYSNNYDNISILLSGIYEVGNDSGYTAKVRISALNYYTFTISMDFNALDFDKKDKNEQHLSILSFGPSYRWFGVIKHPKTGNLTITMNNQRYLHEFKNVKVKPKRWNNIVCSFNLNEKMIIVYFNGKKLPVVKLPSNIKIKVVGTDAEESDKTISFTNYSNNWTFHGYVNSLIIYNRSLSDIEVKELIRLRKTLL